MKIKIDKDISSEINIARKKLRMSQKMLARKIGISQQTLQRIESGINKTCDKEVLKKIYQILELDITQVTASNTTAKSFRIPDTLLYKIHSVKIKKKLSNDTEALIFCLEEFFSNVELSNTKYEIEEFIEDILNKTFINELKKMGRSNERYESVLKMIEDKNKINVVEYFNEYDEKVYSKIHAERMK